MTSNYDKSKGTGKRGIDVIVREGGGGGLGDIKRGDLGVYHYVGLGVIREVGWGQRNISSLRKKKFSKKTGYIDKYCFFFMYLTGL